MKFNRKLIPFKVHYFCFLGCMSPILPFLIVVGVQLGIPVSVTGTLSSISLLLIVFMKPLVAAMADSFPAHRRAIFLLTLTLMVTCYSSLVFIPPMKEVPKVKGQLVRPVEALTSQEKEFNPLVATNAEKKDISSKTLLLAHGDGACYVAVAWDCIASCSQPWACLSSNTSTTDIRITALPRDNGLKIFHAAEETSHFHTFSSVPLDGSPPLWGEAEKGEGQEERGHLYQLEGANVTQDLIMANVSLECGGGQWEGKECDGSWTYLSFWIFTALFFVGQTSFNTAISVTDAIIVDTIGQDGDYGIQRAWGTVGWGLMGPISGLLIDWWSGSSLTKDYTPAFLICFILGSTDVLLSAAFIKVPEIKIEHNIWKKVWPVLRQPRFFVFCCFVILNGLFDGVVASYIFIMQEDMARGTEAMSYMKFLQGLTLFVQCGIEAPFMFINNWFMQKFGANNVTSIVFFLYIFRLLGLSVVGAYGPVWATLLVEILNGPCYGLGYTAIVVYSAKVSPPGTSTTVQSVVNICYESIGYAVALFVGGLLYSSLGGPGTYLVAGITATITFAMHFIAIRLMPPPEMSENGDTLMEPPGKDIEKTALNVDSVAPSNEGENTSVGEDRESVAEDRESVELQPENQL
ncbi:uncharacterized protein LOC121863032 isoform X2 [Homarus americanus]|uniref:Putative MFS_1 like family-like protein 3 n=2 Tax=Homarus americanus TaxID=6706 RepID=A0A8J5ND02_HOMAM|nr:uncharacterized protein LOC121863032 isoform X2 [Homarus americanus]KAG7177745.1 putative MFS_1 like family-like protein 3 [Homarus americanus]